MSDTQRRNHFRVEYPAHERPKLRISGVDYKILDISESGLRFEQGLRGAFKGEDEVKGAITFSDGMSFLVLGKVLRVVGDAVIVFLVQGVPFARMLSEERYILQKYGRKTG